MISLEFSSKLIKSASVYTIANVINSAIPFLLLPILTRYLNPNDYGIVAMFQVLFAIVMAVIGFNSQSALSRQYFERNIINFPEYLTNCIYLFIISIFLISFTFLIFSGIISTYTSIPMQWLWVVIALAVCNYFIMLVLILWQVQSLPIYYGCFQILLTFTNLGASIFFIVLLQENWQGRIKGQLIAFLIFACFSLIILSKNKWIKFRFRFDYIRHAFCFGSPLIMHSIGALAISMTDRVLLTNMVGINTTGIYVVGAQIGMIIGILEDSFNRAYVPWLFGKLKEGSELQNVKIVKLTYVYCIVIILLALCVSQIAPWFLDFFVGNDFRNAKVFVFWIAMGYAFNGMYKMVANYFFYTHKTNILALITILTAVINVILTYILIDLNGAIGAAQGTMCAFLMSAILTWVISLKIYEMPWNLKISMAKRKLP